MRALARKALGLAAVAIVAVLAVAVGRAATRHSAQVPPGVPAAITLDSLAAADRLAALVRLQTIAWSDPSKRDIGAFEAVQQVLAVRFPRARAAMTLEVIGGGSLLYTWPGTQRDLSPVVFCAHLDVVPVEPGTEAAWTQPPFDGVVAEGSVWGRGTLDDKLGVAGLFEAAEALVAAGFAPTRTVYFAFGHNEESDDDRESGAAAIAASLETRGVHDAIVMDEGGLVDDQVKGIPRPVAFVGVAEKGFMNVELTAHSDGGHASMPPTPTAVGRLARALDRLDRQPMPARLDGAARQLFETLAPDLPFPMRLAMSNLWITRPLVTRALSSQPSTNALIRTTAAPTMLEGSPKANVLAQTARAVVNLRLLPGDTTGAVLAHVRTAVDDPAIDVRALGTPRDASPVSPANGRGFPAIARAIRAIYPDVLVAPFLTMAGTDARVYARIAPETFRFLPVYQAGALESLHGTNEHVQLDVYEKAIRVYATAIKELAQ
jgi:carboxypeptidase PM20D1